MVKTRLDQALAGLGLAATRSQAESLIKLGRVKVDGKVITKPGFFVSSNADIKAVGGAQYVSRAGLKLASVAGLLKLNFKGRVVLDVGSSTGGFTDFSLQNGAKRVIAVDVGTDQLHPSLRTQRRVELHEKTDIRNLKLKIKPDIIVMDLSFISLRQVLPHIATLSGPNTQIVAMFKPQFEADSSIKHKGVIKNDRIRRDLLKDFELWLKQRFTIIDKADSEVAGAKGNRERFYLIKIGNK